MKYFIYTRKSTDSEERQVLSIESQVSELKEFAAKEKLEIVASLCEAKTAKEPGRTVFGEMLARIEKGEAQGILIMSKPRGEVRPDNGLAAAGAGDLRLCRPLSGAPGRA